MNGMNDINTFHQSSMDISPEKRKKNRVYFITALIGVLIVGGTFAALTLRALNIRAHTGSEFTQYVLDHHLGTAELSDDASGFQGDFMVLHAATDVAVSDREAFLVNTMKAYYSLDGGNLLTVDYVLPGSSKNQVIGDAEYNPQDETVTLNIHTPNGVNRVNVKVDWPASNADGS